MSEKINVLGTEYSIMLSSPDKDEKLKYNVGYCDQYAKKIVIDAHPEKEAGVMAIDDMDAFVTKVLRHEIIHAFLVESGLRGCSEWAENEEMVDWIAVQFTKIYDAIRDASEALTTLKLAKIENGIYIPKELKELKEINDKLKELKEKQLDFS